MNLIKWKTKTAFRNQELHLDNEKDFSDSETKDNNLNIQDDDIVRKDGSKLWENVIVGKNFKRIHIIL